MRRGGHDSSWEFLNSDIWYNVFSCSECGIAWCVSEQLEKIVEKPEAVKNLEITLYDPNFKPDNEKKERCKNCEFFNLEEMVENDSASAKQEKSRSLTILVINSHQKK